MYAAKSASGLGQRRSSLGKHSGSGHMTWTVVRRTWPIARIACAISQTEWPIARVMRTNSPSIRRAGHLSRANGRSEWPIGQMGRTVGQMTRKLPECVYSGQPTTPAME